MCIYCCGVIADRFPFNGWVKAGIGAVLMLLLDAVIEPIAMKMGFWQWENNLIPLWNYGTWFIASFMLLCLYYRLPFQKDNLVATTLYLTLWLFFGFLNFV
jgi:putative membrane protein